MATNSWFLYQIFIRLAFRRYSSLLKNKKHGSLLNSKHYFNLSLIFKNMVLYFNLFLVMGGYGNRLFTWGWFLVEIPNIIAFTKASSCCLYKVKSQTIAACIRSRCQDVQICCNTSLFLTNPWNTPINLNS